MTWLSRKGAQDIMVRPPPRAPAPGGTIRGPLISYGNTEFKLTGNSNLTINRATYPGLPPGLVGTLALEPDVGTYREN